MIPKSALARMAFVMVVGPALDATFNTVRALSLGLRVYHEVSLGILDLIEPR